jgi:hypothetical protein
MTDAGGSNLATDAAGQPFDLNIERVLEHWPVANAVREFIANALDEHFLTGTSEPRIERVADGSWIVEDFGRGVRYDHLTQKENPEKLKHPDVIGQFGIGLKDALAVCDRRDIGIVLRSRHGDIRIARRAKAGFSDIVTLHGLVGEPADPRRVGTRVELSGVKDADVDAAKAFFLVYSGDRLLEKTKFGDVFARPAGSKAGRIYVKGLLVAEEPNFLFSYNITRLSAALRRALNRERTNVGRTAYSDRVKEILKECRSAEVVGPLAEDLGRFVSGRMHDELSWKDVAVHACRVLQTLEKVVFITPWQTGLAVVEYAVQDGYRPVIVPEDIARALGGLTDLDGAPMVDLSAYRKQWNDSFTFVFVEPADMTDVERANYFLFDPVCALAGITPTAHGVKSVLISETMRLGDEGGQVLGVFESDEERIVIRRDQLATAADFCGTLLHELEHAASGADDATLEFEEALSRRLGIITSRSLNGLVSNPK